MNISRAPESIQHELASWAWRGAKQILKDPETRKEFEQWKAQKKSAEEIRTEKKPQELYHRRKK